MLQAIKIYGERNTGTNIVREALAKHFYCDFLPEGTRRPQKIDFILNSQRLSPIDRILYEEALMDDIAAQHLTEDLGWKHACPPLRAIAQHPRAKQILFVIITKSPYAWLLSLFKRPYHQLFTQDQSFSEFIRNYWICVRREGPTALMDNPIALYNAKLKAYQNLQAMGKKLALNIIHIRYEDFLFHFDASMACFESLLERRQPNQIWEVPGVSNKGDALNFEGYQKKYQPEALLKRIAAEDLSFINIRLQPSLLRAFGYQLELK